jgi:hypothetical protein
MVLKRSCVNSEEQPLELFEVFLVFLFELLRSTRADCKRAIMLRRRTDARPGWNPASQRPRPTPQ